MGNSKEKIKSIAPTSIHAKAISLIQKELPGKVLDIPCGEGYASEKLNELGFQVYAADIVEPPSELCNIEEFKQIDMNFPIPHETDFFDYIYCIEGIEHIENPFLVVSEFHRILKPNGKLIISTPNLLNVSRRLRYFILGYSDWFHERINLVETHEISPSLTLHISPLAFPALYFILRTRGFEIESTTTNHYIYVQENVFIKTIFLMIFLFIKSFTFLFRPKLALKEILLSKELFFGESLIIKARKDQQALKPEQNE